jgi:hypothetical protein
MAQPHDRFGLEMLVELISAEQSQALVGTPVDRVESRLEMSLALARRAGLDQLVLHLDRQDFAWLCNARVVDRLSSSASVMKVDGALVRRAKPGMDSHITGFFPDGREGGQHPFPIIGDPSLIPDFVTHVPTEAEKAAMLERFKAAGQQNALHLMLPGGTVH